MYTSLNPLRTRSGTLLLVLGSLYLIHILIANLTNYTVTNFMLSDTADGHDQRVDKKDIPELWPPQNEAWNLSGKLVQARLSMTQESLSPKTMLPPTVSKHLGPQQSMSQLSVPPQSLSPQAVTQRQLVPTARPRSCNKCFTRPYSLIINSPEVCAGTNSSMTLLILITTTHEKKERRDAIRLTWGSLTNGNSHPKVRYAFLLGSLSHKHDALMAIERAKHKDIILGSFTDSYKNLTLKTLMALEWATTFCPTAKYILKTDHDVYTHVENMLKLLENQKMTKKLSGSIFGSCNQLAHPIRVKASKYYASVVSYPEKTYPGFCSGTGYVIPRQIAVDILKISPDIPFFFLEDVYIALCIQKLGYRLQGQPGFYPWLMMKYLPVHGCGVFGTRSVHTVHRVLPPLTYQIWKKCPQRITET